MSAASLLAEALGASQNTVLRVEGCAMIEEDIRDGDTLIVSGRGAVAGAPVVVRVGEDLVAGRLVSRNGVAVSIRSLDRDPPRFRTYAPAEVQGVLVAVIRNYDGAPR